MKMLRYKIFLSLVLLAGWSTLSSARENVGNLPTHPVTTGHKATASTCPRTNAQIDLKVNNVRARILDGGDLWWDPNDNTTGIYEVPIGSGKNVIYAGSLWIGGIDASGQLKVAAQTYRQNGANDFWSGPISKDGSGSLNITQNRCNQFDRFWSVDKETVRDFANTGVIPNTTDGKAIQEWPGDGDVSIGELPTLAPYFDANNDGKYNYLDGDYPYFFFGEKYPDDPNTGSPICNDYLFGDRSIWWVFNDVGNVKTESNSDAIGLEIRAQAFAFKTSDEINDMTFYKYQIINRSNDSLNQTYFGVWCDSDLGDAGDDYVGCDVGLGLGYVYNGKPTDAVYGANPPAIGIDFFQGPLADLNDGIDNNKDGRIDEIGEDITTSKFVYYINQNGIPTGNPAVTDDYYNYLNGEWLDGQIVTYGGDGRGAGPGATSIPCDYMFPGKTDLSNQNFTEWTMVTGGIQPADMRFLESAGKFSLAPGAVNYVVDGVVFAQASSGGPLVSVTKMKSADIAAQKLFKSCFQVKDGPPAPDLAIRELDQQLILSFENINKTEGFKLLDVNIPGVIPANGITDTVPATLTNDDRSYLFEGYKIYQVIDPTVKPSEFENPARAKLIAQLDLKNNYTILVNYKRDDLLGGIYVPTQKTEEVNAGIIHTFNITNDLFRQIPLSNFRPYYFTVIAYAANNFRPFNQAINQFELNTQSEPYLPGSKNVFVYSGIPHKENLENSGTVLNSAYGTGLPVTRIEGTGNGGNSLDLTQASIDEIMSSPQNRALHPQYQGGHSPVLANVYDPMKVKAGNFTLAFSGNASKDHWQLYSNPTDTIYNAVLSYNINSLEFSIASTFTIPLNKGAFFTLTGVSGITTTPVGVNLNYTFVTDSAHHHDSPTSDTIFFHVPGVTALTGSNAGALKITIPLKNSSFEIGNNVDNDEIYEPNKIGFKVKRSNLEPGYFPVDSNPSNGFIEATITANNWLSGVADNDVANSAQNWIASGLLTVSNTNLDGLTNLANVDPNSIYEKVLGGTWAPFKTTQRQFVGSPKLNTLTIETLAKWSSIASVDIVLTSDKSKWTRSTVIEIGEDTMPNIGGAAKFNRRKQASIDKQGNPYTSSLAIASEATLTDTVGMGWFPGYAINVETGERLNIAYGENSSLTVAYDKDSNLVNQNSHDMIFNPSSTIGRDTNRRVTLGGGHYIYVFNKNGNTATDIPIYDNGKKIDSLLSINSIVTKRNVYKDCIWTSLPIVKANHTLLETDVTIRLRVVKDIKPFVSIGQSTVYGAPLYQINVDGKLAASVNQENVAKSALDNIRVVPNPYYAYSSYENTKDDKLDNRIRITNLPPKCTVTIFTMGGTLVRTYRRDVLSDNSDGFQINSGTDNNLSSTLDWDLKNTAGITIASGIYLIHVDAGSLGERTVKWFGIIRPIDLNSF